MSEQNNESINVEYIINTNTTMSALMGQLQNPNLNDIIDEVSGPGDSPIHPDNINDYNGGNTGITTNTSTDTLCPAPFYLNDTINYSNITNSSQLFNTKENIFVSETKELKNKMLDILLQKSDYNDKQYDDGNYENKEIDDFCNKITEYNNDFKTIQTDLHKADDNLKKEIESMNNNIKQIDYFINFLDKINSTLEDKDKSELIKSINKLSKKLSETESFIKAKKDYVNQRKKLLKYVYLFKKINKWNIANICTVCYERPVDHYIVPCGHTFCKTCIEENYRLKNINDIQIYSQRNDFKCIVCREGPIQSAKPLYFL
tara:strand:- start:10 stop:960 length:951 start_codon:yes stop_codon:yes gene_type:complete